MVAFFMKSSFSRPLRFLRRLFFMMLPPDKRRCFISSECTPSRLQDCSIFLLRTFQFVVNIDYHIILQIKERNFPYS